LTARKLDLAVERGAGERSHLPDSAFEEAGATVVGADEVWGADVVAVVRAPAHDEIGRLKRGAVLIGFLNPLVDADTARALADAAAASFAMEAIPRITRAQSMDALSSQPTVAGYRAVLLASEGLDRFLQLDVEADAEGAGGYAKELAEEQQRRQQEAMAEAIGRFDVVVTTAAVPGRRAPILVTAAAVEAMKPGSVIVDLAAATGGNC